MDLLGKFKWFDLGFEDFVFCEMSSDFRGNYHMKNEAEVKTKKRAPFQTLNRFGLPDVTLCHSGGSGNAGVI